MRRLGISYSRFSDPKQAKGDSEARQDSDYRAFCQRHNLTPVSEVYADRGRSGYHDEHRKRGRLGELVAMAKDKAFDPGTVIVVEAWDRLGRLRPDKQTQLVSELVHTGVAIGVCRLDDIFTEEDFGTHKWTTLAVFIQLAYQESKQKAERVTHSWKSRRERLRVEGEASREILSGRVPAWLRVVDDRLQPLPERVAVLKRIFRLSAEGYGRRRIVGTLAADKVPPFDTEKWTVPYLSRIFGDRRVLGEYQPRKTDGTPDGAVIRGYYPQVISEEEYQLHLAARPPATGGRGKRGQRDRKYVNVFHSLLVHARDGEGFFLHTRTDRAAPYQALVNAAGNDGRAPIYTFPYHIFEAAVLSLLREVNPVDVLPNLSEPAGRADALRGRLTTIRESITGLQADLKAGYSKALAATVRELEDEEEKLAAELQEELSRAVKPANKAWQELPGLAAVIQTEGDPARLKLRLVLRSIVESALVLTVRRGTWHLAAVQFHFRGGARRDYLIVNRAAGRGRQGRWWARSLSTIIKDGDLDLRQSADVERLEQALRDAPLE